MSDDAKLIAMTDLVETRLVQDLGNDALDPMALTLLAAGLVARLALGDDVAEYAAGRPFKPEVAAADVVKRLEQHPDEPWTTLEALAKLGTGADRYAIVSEYIVDQRRHDGLDAAISSNVEGLAGRMLSAWLLPTLTRIVPEIEESGEQCGVSSDDLIAAAANVISRRIVKLPPSARVEVTDITATTIIAVAMTDPTSCERSYGSRRSPFQALPSIAPIRSVSTRKSIASPRTVSTSRVSGSELRKSLFGASAMGGGQSSSTA
ncbi:MAG: hypothetical protein AAFY64_06575 [Pseudomonadota bacterium]